MKVRPLVNELLHEGGLLRRIEIAIPLVTLPKNWTIEK